MLMDAAKHCRRAEVVREKLRERLFPIAAFVQNTIQRSLALEVNSPVH